MTLDARDLSGGEPFVELREALSQIAEIRAKVAEAEPFRGYRAAPVALTGLLAVFVAFLQSAIVPNPSVAPHRYVLLWLTAALVSGAVAGSGLWLRHRRSQNRLAKQLTWLAIGQFAPCLVAGGLMTAILIRQSAEHLELLPGLWQVFFSLGLFASWRLMPRALLGVALFYLCSGLFNLTLWPEPYHPWVMGVPFGFGQMLAGAVLYWNLEREVRGERSDD